jgi:hypothetical protein
MSPSLKFKLNPHSEQKESLQSFLIKFLIFISNVVKLPSHEIASVKKAHHTATFITCNSSENI